MTAVWSSTASPISTTSCSECLPRPDLHLLMVSKWTRHVQRLPTIARSSSAITLAVTPQPSSPPPTVFSPPITPRIRVRPLRPPNTPFYGTHPDTRQRHHEHPLCIQQRVHLLALPSDSRPALASTLATRQPMVPPSSRLAKFIGGRERATHCNRV